MLDALEEAGVEVMSDDGRGERGLCAVNIVQPEGEVDHRDVFCSDEQKRDNHKGHTCVSRAIRSITLPARLNGRAAIGFFEA